MYDVWKFHAMRFWWWGVLRVVAPATLLSIYAVDCSYISQVYVYDCELNDFNEWHLGVSCITTTIQKNINNNKRKIVEICIYLHMKKVYRCLCR